MIHFEQLVVRQYQFWTLYLNERQNYLGRCYVALNREGNLDPFVDCTAEEKQELDSIMQGLNSALNRLFQVDMFNYANLRNYWPHCHWHVVPRYATPREFGGLTFTDENWGHNWAPYNKDFRIPPEVLF